MKLTPLDLQNKVFRAQRLGGADRREVKAFLELCASEMEELIRKLHAQEEELRRRATNIAEYRESEQLLQATLTSAQKLTEEMKAQGRREAGHLIADAELQAEKIVANAQARRLQLVGEIEELKRAKVAFTAQLAALLDAHRAVLESSRGETDARGPGLPADNVSFLAPQSKRADK